MVPFATFVRHTLPFSHSLPNISIVRHIPAARRCLQLTSQLDLYYLSSDVASVTAAFDCSIPYPKPSSFHCNGASQVAVGLTDASIPRSWVMPQANGRMSFRFPINLPSTCCRPSPQPLS